MSPTEVPRRPLLGFIEWFRPGEYERVEAVLAELREVGATRLRTHLSWAEFLAPGGPEWYGWLLPKLGAELDLLPCIHYTPPSLSRTGKSSGAPVRLRDYADFVDQALTLYGKSFHHVELWNEPNNLLDWDWRADPDYSLFCEMINDAANWLKQRGYSPVLGGPAPFDPVWVGVMGQRGVLEKVDAVGIHGFPGTWDSEAGSWEGWDVHIGEMRRILDSYNPDAEIWITETGYSTWRNDEVEQARRFVQALDVPADRLYWYGWRDIARDVAVQEGHLFDLRHYHFGATTAKGRPKLLARLLADGGVPRVREVASLAKPLIIGKARPVVVTGGSGFLGSNLADSLLEDGEEVVILDNLSRPGVERNLVWLKERHGDRVHPHIADVRDPHAFEPVIGNAKAVFHMAAQVAVTTSLADPTEDFDVNAGGTLNLLEAARHAGGAVPIVFTSTNKVYGALDDLPLVENVEQYVPEDPHVRRNGVGEDRCLQFCTPYGCSKGAADQYVLDYASSFGLPAAVLRMSCVYGPRQFGTEDQGWLAHFMICALENRPITVFGDGKQVRDLLYVRDAVAAHRQVLGSIGKLSGQAFNLGGGPLNAVSLRMALSEIARLTGLKPRATYGDWRTGDQCYYVSDTRRLERSIGWRARTHWRDGLKDLAEWLKAQQSVEKAGQPERLRA